MKPSSIIITQDTSLNTVLNFLNVGNSDKQIRAKDLGNGAIKLYVRKDTFKQFFTDKLRLSSNVKRDYTKARNHILNLVEKTDSSGKSTATILSIKASLPENKDGFYAGNFINLQTALYPKGEISTLTEILEFGRSETNFDESILIARGDMPETQKEKLIEWLGRLDDRRKLNAFLQDKNILSEIINVSNSIENTNDRNLFLRNFEALQLVAEYPSPRLSRLGLKPSVIDYKCAVDFFPAWQKAIKAMNTNEKNLENNQLLNAINETLTSFAEAVERRGVPDKIDLNGGEFENSDADLIIFDSSTAFTPFTNFSTETNDYTIKGESVSLSHNDTAFGAKTYPEKHVTPDKDFTAGFGIFYLPDQKIDQEFMDSLYNKIESTISEKISQKRASSSQSIAEDNRDDEIYTIHLPVMNPFIDQNLKPEERTMIQQSFAEATKEWLRKYPNLRIKVNLAEPMDIRSIQARYRAINKSERTN